MPITISSNMTATYSGSTVTSATTTDSITESPTLIAATTILGRHILNTQTVGTSREAAYVGDVVTTQSYLVRLRNLDATNYVAVETYDATNYTDCGIMYPGEIWGPVRMPLSHVLHLTANTASCQVEVMMAEAGTIV